MDLKKFSLQKAIADYVKLYEMGMEPGRRPFLDRLFSFLDEKGTPINTMPVISKQPLDLYRLYVIVQEKGGMLEVCSCCTNNLLFFHIIGTPVQKYRELLFSP